MQEDTVEIVHQKKNMLTIVDEIQSFQEKMTNGEISCRDIENGLNNLEEIIKVNTNEIIKDVSNPTLVEQMKTFPGDIDKMMKGEMSYSDMRLRYG